jgi:hypothetical protein
MRILERMRMMRVGGSDSGRARGDEGQDLRIQELEKRWNISVLYG